MRRGSKGHKTKKSKVQNDNYKDSSDSRTLDDDVIEKENECETSSFLSQKSGFRERINEEDEDCKEVTEKSSRKRKNDDNNSTIETESELEIEKRLLKKKNVNEENDKSSIENFEENEYSRDKKLLKISGKEINKEVEKEKVTDNDDDNDAQEYEVTIINYTLKI